MSKHRIQNSRKRRHRANARKRSQVLAKAGATSLMVGTLSLATCGVAVAATTGGTTTSNSGQNWDGYLLPPGSPALPTVTPSASPDSGTLVLPPGDISDPSLAAKPPGDAKTPVGDNLAVLPSSGQPPAPSVPQGTLLVIAGPAPVRPNDSDPLSVLGDVPPDPVDPPANGGEGQGSVEQNVFAPDPPADPPASPQAKTAPPPPISQEAGGFNLTASQKLQLQQAADKAQSLVGVAEKPLGSNAGGLVDVITGGIPQQWCGLFGIYVWKQAGIAPFFTGATAAYGDGRPDDELGRVLKLPDNFPSIQGQLQDRGQYIARQDLKSPPPDGSFVFFGEGGVGHMAVVVSSTETHVTVVGGNEHNRVQKDTYKLTASDILGYGVPFSAATAAPPAPAKPPTAPPPTQTAPKNDPVIVPPAPKAPAVTPPAPTSPSPTAPADPGTTADGTTPAQTVPSSQAPPAASSGPSSDQGSTPATTPPDSSSQPDTQTPSDSSPSVSQSQDNGTSTDVLAPSTNTTDNGQASSDGNSGSPSTNNGGDASITEVTPPASNGADTTLAPSAVVGGVLGSDASSAPTTPVAPPASPPAKTAPPPPPPPPPPAKPAPATPAPAPGPQAGAPASLPPILAGYWQYIAPSSHANDVDPLLLAAVFCREHSGTCISNPNGDSALLNVNGDGGHGRGVGQIDDRSHGPWLAAHDGGLDPASNIAYAAQLLGGYIQHFADKGLSANDAMRYGVAAYNAGVGGAEAGLAHGNPDRMTAGRDYSSWVMNKYNQFKNH